MHTHIAAHNVVIFGLSAFVFLATLKLVALHYEGHPAADAALHLL